MENEELELQQLEAELAALEVEEKKTKEPTLELKKPLRRRRTISEKLQEMEETVEQKPASEPKPEPKPAPAPTPAPAPAPTPAPTPAPAPAPAPVARVRKVVAARPLGKPGDEKQRGIRNRG